MKNLDLLKSSDKPTFLIICEALELNGRAMTCNKIIAKIFVSNGYEVMTEVSDGCKRFLIYKN
jgi:hypothetical protein